MLLHFTRRHLETSKGEQKGEQILQRKKVIKSTFDNLKKSQKSTNFNEFSRQGTSVSNWYAFLFADKCIISCFYCVQSFKKGFFCAEEGCNEIEGFSADISQCWEI